MARARISPRSYRKYPPGHREHTKYPSDKSDIEDVRFLILKKHQDDNAKRMMCWKHKEMA